jgi:hypothetical protein
MNPNAVTKHYSFLTAEERFQLILAAEGRGDDADQHRLNGSGGAVTLTTRDHTPFARAFDELSTLVFLGLQDEAHKYLHAFARSRAATQDKAGQDSPDADQTGARQSQGSLEDRCFDLVLAAGYRLRTKTEGWQLFCQRRHLPPFALWENLPGFQRWYHTLERTAEIAFEPEGLLCWLNRVRPAGTPEKVEVPLTAEGVADDLERMFQQSVRSWGG